MDMHLWLTQIGDSIRFQSLNCWIGVSYLMRTIDGQVIYVYCAKALAFHHEKLRTKV